ncbi:MAG TPA: (deoxy)nucleoside triphosphate pyrophosphohydrolase [Dissulfurispiraceae bacterium]|nr:(deoxy)nucleoside triphosphate pyrophosphohydrolase [Dissulfurispiraceae bacterium]
MKHLHVACAIIQREGKVLATQRGADGNLPLKWEFPGGKIHPGETPEDCLHRELNEEVGIGVDIIRALPPSTHSYQTFTVTLYPFVCSIRSGEIVLHEHAASVWLAPEDLPALDWAEADLPVIRAVINAADHKKESP